MGEINRRVFDMMKQKKKKVIGLSRKINVPPNTISTWKIRGTDPPADLIPDIAEYLETTAQYLLTGVAEDSLYKDHGADGYMNRLFKEPNLRMLLDATDNLSKEDIDLLVQFARKMKGTRED
jgi:transcriptional regulator with XRE-family HTH domain